ncbi:MAG: hypothetical protein RIQ81_2662 [Pseudomonadota bacterium]|jgi:hypothetical protein
MLPANSDVVALTLVQATLIPWLGGIALLRMFRKNLFYPSFPWTSFAGLPLATGLLLRYAVELLTGNSLYADIMCLATAVAGALPALEMSRSVVASRFVLAWRYIWLFPVFCLMISWLSVVSPILMGDAKVMWFFHGKMIFFAKGINMAAGFDDPSVVFSHPDYPKLVATTGAAIANIATFWNDYLPKFSVALVQLPVFAFFCDLISAGQPLLGLVLLISGTSAAGTLLYNGYMDGLLGLWLTGFLGALFCLVAPTPGKSRPPSERRELPGFFAAMALVMLPLLKYEGLPLALIFAGVSGFLFRGQITARLREKHFFKNHSYACAVAALGVFCFAIWRLNCLRWGLSNDLSGDLPSMLQRLQGRVVDPSAWRLCLDYFSDYFAPPWLLAISVALGLLIRKKGGDQEQEKVVITCFAGGFLYVLFLLFVYLGTHHDLFWHLNFSSLRTLMPAQNALMAGFGLFMLSRR